MTNISSISLITLITEADLVVKGVMALLFFSSIWCWTVIFDKIIKFLVLKKRTESFEEKFDNLSSLDEIYKEAVKNNNHPLSRMFISAMKEWKLSNVKQIKEEGDPHKKQSLKDRLLSEMHVTLNKSMKKMENGLGFLAIIGSTAPFVGLFGTVWGIMNSFQGIASSKNTSLAVVAPGIAEALLATAMGLFAAIPAVFFYNIFSHKINSFFENYQNFASQLLNLLSKELDR